MTSLIERPNSNEQDDEERVEIDVDVLAERVYALLLEELRLASLRGNGQPSNEP